jgi:nucleoside-diphosphate-sugar epimerase
MTRPKVLVTGGGGLLGHHVIDALMVDHEVEVLDLKRPDRDVRFHRVDVRDLEAVVQAVQGHHRIVHLASIDDGTPLPDPDYASVNIQGTWNLFHAAEAAGVGRVVIASSSASFGVTLDQPPLRLPIDEGHVQRPRRTYDLTKQVMERIAESYARRGLISSVTALRPTLVARPEKTPEMIAELSTLSKEDGNPGVTVAAAIYGGLPLLRTYVTSRDCAAAFRAALLAEWVGYGCYIVAADDTLGSVETLGWLQRKFGTLPEVSDAAYFADRPTASPLDNRRAKAALGWAPQDDWASVIQEVIGL